jgi:rhamnulokinase
VQQYLAFDLGAESGRPMLGRFESGRLELSELHRFANVPVSSGGSLRWDIRRLFEEMQCALDLAPANLTSIGVDTWGIDYALLDRDGALLENPFHYRDRRTEGVMDRMCAKISRERIYAATGVQFLAINTLFQLCATSPEALARAASFLTIPDLLNFWLTGAQFSEYSNASTTQLLNAGTRDWAWDLIAELNLPERIFRPIIQPGTRLGPLKIASKLQGVPVIAPACHDTGSAVAAIEMSARSVFLSSGTWSLLGAELTEPIVTPLARDHNFTNEGGVCGTIRFLKNIAGLWLLQSCRNCWSREGRNFSYDELLNAAAAEQAMKTIVDPDHPIFLNPVHMPQAIAEYCIATAQSIPQSPPAFARMILESLAQKYREVLTCLKQVTGRSYDEIRIVGGGSKNRLLNQLTADATGRVVVAGPVEATALGNIAMQMLATGAISSLAQARGMIAESFPVEKFMPAERRD